MAILFKQSALIDFHKAIFTALAPITTQTGIKVYDHVPESQEKFPYIVVSDMTEQSWGDKTAEGSQITVNINCYVKDKSSMSMKNIIDLVIKTLDGNITVTGWRFIYQELSDNMVSAVENSVYLGTVSCNYFLLKSEDENDQ